MGSKMSRDSLFFELRYRKWWEGKRCMIKSNSVSLKFKRVVEVEFVAPPSGIYGVVIFYYSDGEREYVTPQDRKAFKPRKFDVLIEKGNK